MTDGRAHGATPVARRFLARPLRVVGGIALLAMMVVTIADVLGRSLIGMGVEGVVDIVELLLVWAVFLGIAVAFLDEAHITVDLIDTLVPPRALAVVSEINRFVAFAIVAGLGWLAIDEWLLVADWGDRTVDLSIPLTWHWSAIVAGYAASALFVLVRFAGGLPAAAGRTGTGQA